VIERSIIACFGECMTELRSEAPGLWRQAFAGDACNTAVYLARILQSSNWKVSWVSTLGDDHFAKPMMAFWQSEGLQTHLVRRLIGGTTGLYAIQLDDHGERQFSYWRSSSAAREYFNDVAALHSPLEQSVSSLAGLHFSGISLAILPEEGRQRLLQVAKQVSNSGGWVSFDTNFRPRLWETKVRATYWMRQALSVCDRALVSIDDWMQLTEQDDEDLTLHDLRHFARPELIIKRGAKATWICPPGSPVIEVPVIAVSHPVDTTAAGDAFAAAYLAARLEGLCPEESVLSGHCLSREVIMHPGAITPRKL
jgi:2-dehydro-3-deoxygluconokinase